MFTSWCKVFLYHIRKSKWYFLLSIVSLGLGIWAFTLAFLFFSTQQLYDEHNPYKNEVFFVEGSIKQYNSTSFGGPFPLGAQLKENYDFIEDYMYFSSLGNQIISFQEQNFSVGNVFSTTSNFFDFFPNKLLERSSESHVFDGVNTAAIEVKEAQKIFGDTSALGKQLTVGKSLYTISAVYDLEDNLGVILPGLLINSEDQRQQEQKDNWFLINAVLLLKSKQPSEIVGAVKEIYSTYVYAARAQRMGVSLQEYLQENADVMEEYKVISLKQQHFNSSGAQIGSAAVDQTIVYAVLILGSVILLGCTINFVNISLIQSLKRAKEKGLRNMMGATKRQVALQSFFEISVYFFIGALIAMTLLELTIDTASVVLNAPLTLNGLSAFYIVFCSSLLMSVVSSLIVGSYASSFKLIKIFRGNYAQSSSSSSLRNALLCVQFFIGSVFVISAWIFTSQIDYMLGKDKGFNMEHIVKVRVNSTYEEYLRFKQEIQHLEAVDKVSGAVINIGSSNAAQVKYGYEDQELDILLNLVSVDYDFLELMEFKKIEGRYFSPQIVTDTLEGVVINKTFADLLGTRAELGSIITIDEEQQYPAKIIGVVDDFNISEFTKSYEPVVFVHFNQPDFKWMKQNIGYIYVKLKPGYTSRAIVDIEQGYNRVGYNSQGKKPFKYAFIQEEYKGNFSELLLQSKVFIVLNFIILFICFLGLFAVCSFSIANQYKQIAIKKVLGASTQHLVLGLSKQYIGYCLLGFTLAILPTYYIMEQWLSQYVFRIYISIGLYVLTLLFMLCLTLSIVCLKALRATRINLVEFIKHE